MVGWLERRYFFAHFSLMWTVGFLWWGETEGWFKYLYPRHRPDHSTRARADRWHVDIMTDSCRRSRSFPAARGQSANRQSLPQYHGWCSGFSCGHWCISGFLSRWTVPVVEVVAIRSRVPESSLSESSIVPASQRWYPVLSFRAAVLKHKSIPNEGQKNF